MLNVNASALDSYDSRTFLTDFFADLNGGTNKFYGGTADGAFGGTYYMNGSQILSTYTAPGEGEGVPNVASDKVAMLEGEGLAYDFIHHGAAYGHDISGRIDSLTLASWVEATSSATQGTGDAGKVAGLNPFLTIDGFDLSVARDASSEAPNTVFTFYNALQAFDAAAINDIIDDYALKVRGSQGDDIVESFGQDDVLRGLDGNDVLWGRRGADHLFGHTGDDELRGHNGADELRGGLGNDVLRGGYGKDILIGGIGDDTLTGGSGGDTFVFHHHASGSDVITDFNIDKDVLDVQKLRVDDLSDFTIASDEHGVTLTAGSVSIELAGLEESDLSSDMFLF